MSAPAANRPPVTPIERRAPTASLLEVLLESSSGELQTGGFDAEPMVDHRAFEDQRLVAINLLQRLAVVRRLDHPLAQQALAAGREQHQKQQASRDSLAGIAKKHRGDCTARQAVGSVAGVAEAAVATIGGGQIIDLDPLRAGHGLDEHLTVSSR